MSHLDEFPAVAVPNPQERYLDAAEVCFAQFGLAKTTVEDVARAAGVSRATLYRAFKNRDELFLAVYLRESARLAKDARNHLRAFDDAGSWIVEGMLFCLAEVPKRPLLATQFGVEEAGRTSRIVLNSGQVLAVGCETLRPAFEVARDRGQLKPGLELEALIDWVVRILISYLTVPSASLASRAQMRTLLRATVLPAILEPSPPQGTGDRTR
jgi:AcrR family transcriptional regulator